MGPGGSLNWPGLFFIILSRSFLYRCLPYGNWSTLQSSLKCLPLFCEVPDLSSANENALKVNFKWTGPGKNYKTTENSLLPSTAEAGIHDGDLIIGDKRKKRESSNQFSNRELDSYRHYQTQGHISQGDDHRRPPVLLLQPVSKVTVQDSCCQ